MFILQASKFDIYVHYCTNKPKSTEVLMAAGDTYFQVGFSFGHRRHHHRHHDHRHQDHHHHHHARVFRERQEWSSRYPHISSNRSKGDWALPTYISSHMIHTPPYHIISIHISHKNWSNVEWTQCHHDCYMTILQHVSSIWFWSEIDVISSYIFIFLL